MNKMRMLVIALFLGVSAPSALAQEMCSYDHQSAEDLTALCSTTCDVRCLSKCDAMSSYECQYCDVASFAECQPGSLWK